MKRNVPATMSKADRARAGLEHLRLAREFLVEAGAGPKCVQSIVAAIGSSRGALTAIEARERQQLEGAAL